LYDYLDSKCRNLFSGLPFLNAPDYVKAFRKILGSREFKEIFDIVD
jgi:hypothetical protein